MHLEHLDVFLSRPTAVSPAQELFCAQIGEHLSAVSLVPRTIGVSEFSNDVPLRSVRRLMAACHGAVVLGLKQHRVDAGVWKATSHRPSPMSKHWLPTPWNQIEGAMAYASELPLLLILEPGVRPEGIFGIGVGEVFVHTADLSGDWLNSPQFQQPFEEWRREVVAHAQA